MRPSPIISYAQDEDPILKRSLIQGIELLTGKLKIRKAYQDAQLLMNKQSSTFWDAALETLNLSLDYSEEALDCLPKEGPLVIVSNHPFGVLDGIILCYLASRIRPSFKILINSVLCRVEELQPYFLPIDFNETKKAIQTNIASKNAALKELNSGGVVLLFPAGGVSTSVSPFSKQIIDDEWKLFAAKLIKKSKATVVPFYFYGHNSRLFQLASHFSLTLRYSLFLHEVKNKMGKPIRVNIGKSISYEEISLIKNKQELMNFLRSQTYALA